MIRGYLVSKTQGSGYNQRGWEVGSQPKSGKHQNGLGSLGPQAKEVVMQMGIHLNKQQEHRHTLVTPASTSLDLHPFQTSVAVFRTILDAFFRMCVVVGVRKKEKVKSIAVKHGQKNMDDNRCWRWHHGESFRVGEA